MPENERINQILAEAAKRKTEAEQTQTKEKQTRSLSTKATYDETLVKFSALDKEHRQAGEDIKKDESTLQQIAEAKNAPEIDETALTELAQLGNSAQDTLSEKQTRKTEIEIELEQNSQAVKDLGKTTEGQAVMAQVEDEARKDDTAWNTGTEAKLKHENPYKYMETKKAVAQEFENYAEHLHTRAQWLESTWKDAGVKWITLARPRTTAQQIGAPWQLQAEITSCQTTVDDISRQLRDMTGFHPIRKSKLESDKKRFEQKIEQVQNSMPAALERMRQAEQELAKQLSGLLHRSHSALPKFETATKAPTFFRRIREQVEREGAIKFDQIDQIPMPDNNNPAKTLEEVGNYIRSLENLSKEIQRVVFLYREETNRP